MMARPFLALASSRPFEKNLCCYDDIRHLVANVVTTHKAFSKDEIRNLNKKEGFLWAHRVGNFFTCLKTLGPKVHFASKHTSTGHKKRFIFHSWDYLKLNFV
jgi:hypothetical protein